MDYSSLFPESEEDEAVVQLTRFRQRLQLYSETVRIIVNADWSKEPSADENTDEEIALQKSGEIVRAAYIFLKLLKLIEHSLASTMNNLTCLTRTWSEW